MSEDLTKTIVDLENKTWQALQKSGADFLPFLSEDCQMLFPMGMRISQTSTPDLRQVMTSDAFEPWKTYEMKDVEVTPIGAHAAIISYKAEATKSDDDPLFRALVSSTWRKDDTEGSGQWLLCHHQQTPYDKEI